MVGALLLCALGMTTTVAAASAGGSAQTSSTKPDLAYFAGKTITMDVPVSTGGPEDLVVRALVPSMASYLHATVNIVDNSTGSGIPSQNSAEAAAPDGLTIGVLRVSADVEAEFSGQPTISFGLLQTAILGGFNNNSGILIGTPSGPTSMLQILKTDPVINDLQTSSGTFPLVMTIIKNAYDLTNLSIVTGYASGGALEQGLLRGDGQISGTALSLFAPLLSSGYRPLMVQTERPIGSQDYQLVKNTPTVAQIFRQYPPKSAAGRSAMAHLLPLTSDPEWFFVPKNTPKAIQLTLTDAIKYAYTVTSARQALAQAGASLRFIPASESYLSIAHSVTGGQFLKPYLKAL